MTDAMKINICKTLISKINAESKIDFAFDEKKCIASFDLKNLHLEISFAFNESGDKLLNVEYILSVDDEKSAKLSLPELLTRLAMIKDFAKPDNGYFECCLCGKLVKGYGNNPAPLMNKGKCCEECNMTKVIPARLEALTNGK